jgi:hypothetical protein
MTETVGFAWWMPADGGSQQAFVQNYNGIRAAGFEPDGFTSESADQMLSAKDFDWAFVPFVFDPEFINGLAENTHVHLQIGGFGRNDWASAEQSIDAADSISVLDPQLAEAFGVPDAPWVPNPPNHTMFEQTENPEDGYILIPKQHETGGLGPERELIEAHPDERFLMLGSSFPDPPVNVTIKPKVPLSWMPEVYAGAKAVMNIVEREGLPNTAYEAFLTGTPYIYRESGSIGSTQITEEPLVEEIGSAAGEVCIGHGLGDHAVRDIHKATPEVGRAGREWAEAWIETGWGWPEKFKYIGEELVR